MSLTELEAVTKTEETKVAIRKEIEAMRKVAEALEPLSHDAIKRVVRWASEYFRGDPDDEDQ